jgi:GMP synthase (glutamine-hydrolysing)
MTNQKIIILDFGSQYTQLIARRVRELQIYCEIKPYNTSLTFDDGVKGIILSGSPFSVNQTERLSVDLNQILGKYPVLAICYGAQLIAADCGGEVKKSNIREYGKAALQIHAINDPIFEGVHQGSQIWMSHSDTITTLPPDANLLAATEGIPVAAYKMDRDLPVYCFQFHPEVTHSLEGLTLLQNFLYNIAGCEPNWNPDVFIDSTVDHIRSTVGKDKVLLGLSGGVDSTVAALLLHKAIGDQLYCFFIDNGLLRKYEFEEVLHKYEGMGLQVIGIDARDQFYSALKRLSDPELKRKAIGRVFIEVFEAEAKKIEGITFLGQGTIYPDVIESVSVHGPSVTIKSHHNVGGLPDRLHLKIIEPLRMLFKDEVRRVGEALGLRPDLLHRHPFPGPGLGIRILGEITPEKVTLLQEADAIFIQMLKERALYDHIWQAGAILLPVFSVGVMGDERTYEQVVALRAVTSSDGMTAEWARIPYDFLADVSTEIINKVKGINRVVYDISTKPPSTIEWE